MLGLAKLTCWNGDVISLAFIIDALGHEIIAWTTVVNARISVSDARDMMLETVEKRFGATRHHKPSDICPTTTERTLQRRQAYCSSCEPDANEIHPHSALKISSLGSYQGS